MRMTGAILGAALTVAFAAPASAADKETRQMMADIRILQEQSQQLQNLIATMTEALKAVNARIDEQTGTNRKLFADQQRLNPICVRRKIQLARCQLSQRFVGSLFSNRINPFCHHSA